LVKGETQVKRIGSLLVRATLLAMLLLTIGGGVANAGGPLGGTSGTTFGATSLPDDPGYDFSQ
jgi:hypothetical protein